MYPTIALPLELEPTEEPEFSEKHKFIRLVVQLMLLTMLLGLLFFFIVSFMHLGSSPSATFPS